MALERVVTKQLAGEQDLLLGEGQVTQTRANGDYTIDKVNLVKWVADAAALNAIDTTKFSRAALGKDNLQFNWTPGDTQTPDNIRVIAGVGGNWIRHDPSWSFLSEATYVSATTFTVPSVVDFHVGRRVKTSEDTYGVITDVSGTTITVELSSGALTSALASVQLGPAADSTSAAVQYYPDIDSTTGTQNHAFALNNVLRYIPQKLHKEIREYTTVTDVSAYIENALTSVSGGTLFLCAGLFPCRDIAVPSFTTLRGAGSPYYGTIQNEGTVLKNKNAVNGILDVRGTVGVGIEQLTLDGVDSSVAGVYSSAANAGTTLTIRKTKIINCSDGIGKYIGSSTVTACYIRNCTVGINSPVDTMISGANYIHANNTGIYLGTGANDNTIVGNKIEWNSAQNISAYQDNHNVIVANVFDRAGKEGIKMLQSSYGIISANIFRRNGATTSTNNEKAHIYLSNTTEVVLSNNVTNSGKNDDGTGNDSPKYGLYIDGTNTGLKEGGNDWSGINTALSGKPRFLAASTTDIQSDTFRSRFTGSIASTATVNTTLATREWVDPYTNKMITLKISIRDSSTGANGYHKVPVLLTRGGAGASYSVGTIVSHINNRTLTVGGSGDIDLQNFVIEQNGEYITFDVANNNANTQLILIEVEI